LLGFEPESLGPSITQPHLLLSELGLGGKWLADIVEN